MRDLFLLDPDVTFLNHGSFGACPRPVFERYQQWQLELERQPVEFLGRRYDSLMQTAGIALARYVGTEPHNLLFVPNATAGLNTVARSLKLRKGDEILTTDHEYGALKLMWEYIARETGAEIVVQTLPTPYLDAGMAVEAIWRGVSPRTRVIFMSHITSVTALTLPVEAIIQRARGRGIFTMIDGAHVPGHLDLNLDELGADFYSGNCHKWLCAPKGSAFLYVAPQHHALIDPLIISWGWDGATLFERTRWQGTRDIAAYLTVPEAIEFHKAHAWDDVRARCHDLVVETCLRVSEITGQMPYTMPRHVGQMAVAPLPAGIDPVLVKTRLYDDFRVEIPVTTHDGRHYLRISMQGYNTRADADALVNALREILSITRTEITPGD